MAKSNLFKIVNGKKVNVSSREVKKFIMSVHGWTSEQYKKHYDIFKNKLRAFEAFEAYSGAKVTKQSAVELLFKEAKAMKREGADYRQSIKMQRINKFTSVSSGKKGQKALQGKRYRQHRQQTYMEATSLQFRGLVENNAMAQEIAMAISDPVKREKALAEYANKLKAKINEQDEVIEDYAIPFGETLGSTDEIDFDYSAYLDD